MRVDDYLGVPPGLLGLHLNRQQEQLQFDEAKPGILNQIKKIDSSLRSPF